MNKKKAARLLKQEWGHVEEEVQAAILLMDKYLDDRDPEHARGKVRELGTFRADPTMLAVYPTDRWGGYEFPAGFPIANLGVIRNVTTIAQKRMLMTKKAGAQKIRTDLLYYGNRLTEYFPGEFSSRRNVLERLSLVRKHEMILHELIVRFNLVGSMWRAYEAGQREFCGYHLPDGMTKGQELPEEYRFTPTTKAEKGHHDENVTAQSVEAQYPGITAFALLVAGEIRENVRLNRGRLLDIKIEIAQDPVTGEFILCDEVSPDSCRFCLEADYDDILRGEEVDFYDKEFGRQWLAFRGARLLDPSNPAHVRRVARWRADPAFVVEFLRRYEVACTFLAGRRTSQEYLREVMYLTHV